MMQPSVDMPAEPEVTKRPTLLVVDDTPANLSLMAGLLNSDYRVKLASSGIRAIELTRREPPDLILMDVMMPEMDGFEVCRRLKADEQTRDIPVIFITAMVQPEDEARGFAVGAADFIHKPISPPIVRSRVRTHLEVKASRDHMKSHAARLEYALDQRLAEVDRLRDATMFVMVALAEFRDSDTGNHVKRTQEYVRALAQYLRDHASEDHEAHLLDDENIDLLAKSAPLHDIGKIAIPDSILLKPGPLSTDAFEIMKSHTIRGWDILHRAAQRIGDGANTASGSAYLRFGMQIARSHHEHWDGQGYPDQLAGDNIPLAARLMAVADVYDALISRRPYKEPMPHAEAMARLRAGAGSHFDPRIVSAAMACEREFSDIASTWQD